MCIAVPAEVLIVRERTAVVMVGGVQCEVSLLMTPEVQVGEYVIVHAGFAIQVLDPAAAQETLSLLTQLSNPTGIFGPTNL